MYIYRWLARSIDMDIDIVSSVSRASNMPILCTVRSKAEGGKFQVLT